MSKVKAFQAGERLIMAKAAYEFYRVVLRKWWGSKPDDEDDYAENAGYSEDQTGEGSSPKLSEGKQKLISDMM